MARELLQGCKELTRIDLSASDQCTDNRLGITARCGAHACTPDRDFAQAVILTQAFIQHLIYVCEVSAEACVLVHLPPFMVHFWLRVYSIVQETIDSQDLYHTSREWRHSQIAYSHLQVVYVL